jgi:hypothetical protein
MKIDNPAEISFSTLKSVLPSRRTTGYASNMPIAIVGAVTELRRREAIFSPNVLENCASAESVYVSAHHI